MTPLPEIHVNPKTIPVLESLGVNTRWLMENSAVTQRAYAEMIAERDTARCSLGVGCDEYGICYAESIGRPGMCPVRLNSTSLKEG